MSSITSVILICTSALLPQDCTVDSATDMLAGLGANTPHRVPSRDQEGRCGDQ